MYDQIDISSVGVFARDVPHPEGVVFDDEGYCYTGVSHGDHLAGGPIMRVSPDGREVTELADTGGRVLGIAIGRDRHLYACDAQQGAVVKVSPNGQCTPYCEGTEDWRLRMPNFCVFDSEGTLYISDSGTATAGEETGAVLRIDSSGRSEKLADGLVFANGLALSEDEGSLFVVETRDDRVLRIDLDRPNEGPEVFASGLESGPDGLAFDERGVLWVTVTRGSRLYAVSQEGQGTVFVEDSEDEMLNFPTNIAWHPDDERTACVANLFGSHLSYVPMPSGGQQLYHER